MLKRSIKFAESKLPTKFGEFTCIIYRDQSGNEHVALTLGNVIGKENLLCRVHSECATSEVFNSLKCDCKDQLDLAMAKIEKRGCGIIVYLKQEGRGIGLGNKIKAYALQELGFDTVDANRELGFADDLRTYEVVAKILEDLNIRSVELLTNNPLKINGLLKNGVIISKRVPHFVKSTKEAQDYLATKQAKMGHALK